MAVDERAFLEHVEREIRSHALTHQHSARPTQGGGMRLGVVRALPSRATSRRRRRPCLRGASMTRATRTCFLCRRIRPVEKMDGKRCADRDRCLRHALDLRPPRVSRATLRKQFGG